MQKNREHNQGFTLAELLIAVAIIGVLIAIAIPSLVKWMEVSKEATDLANVRGAYAQVTKSAMSNEVDAEGYDAASGTWSQTIQLEQGRDGWQGDVPVTIGGVTSGSDGGSNADGTWVGAPAAHGACTVFYNLKTGALIVWGEGGDPDPDPDVPFITLERAMTTPLNQVNPKASGTETLADYLKNFQPIAGTQVAKLDSTGATGAYYADEFRSAFGIPADSEFSYTITKKKGESDCIVYISTDYSIKKKADSGSTSKTMTATAYLYDPSTQRVVKVGKPKTIGVGVASSNGREIMNVEEYNPADPYGW